MVGCTGFAPAIWRFAHNRNMIPPPGYGTPGSDFPNPETLCLESAAADVGRRFAEAMRASNPASNAAWIPIAGGVAAYTGPVSPLTAVKGVHPSLDPASIEKAERFLVYHGARSVVFELAPWISPNTMRVLEARGYRRVSEELVVWHRTCENDIEIHRQGCVREIEDTATWSAILHSAFELPETDEMLALGITMAKMPGAINLGVEAGPAGFVAGAQLLPVGEVAIFGGDGTLAGFRGNGFQLLLIRERLRRAAELGVEIAVAEVLPDSGSARNYFRCGFQVAYSRVHWARESTGFR